MIEEVTKKTEVLQANSLKRKSEEEKLARERSEIQKKKKEIEELEILLREKDKILAEEEADV